MTAIPDVVADLSDDGTLRPNIGDHFEPLFCPEFPHTCWKLRHTQCSIH
jgi:hypothetical protein